MKKSIITVFVCIITIVLLWFYFYEMYKPNNDSNVKLVTLNQTRPIQELKGLVICNNDTIAYRELYNAYTHEQNNSYEYLFYSLLMANKCHYPQAYFDVYELFHNQETIKKDLIFDKGIRVLMIEYLKKGAALNHSQSKYELGELYMEGKYLPKDTILGKKLIEKSGFLNINLQ